jgi:hypothetical protein
MMSANMPPRHTICLTVSGHRIVDAWDLTVKSICGQRHMLGALLDEHSKDTSKMGDWMQ